MKQTFIICASLLCLGLTAHSRAATYTETDSSSGVSATYDANIQNDDLIEGITASSNVGSGDGGTPLSALNDGAASDATVGGNTNDLWFDDGYGAPLGIGSTLPSNPVLTYTLPTTPGNLGFTITSINSIFGYGGQYADPAMADQNFSISYSTVVAPSVFVSLGTVDYDPFGDGGGGSSSQVNLSDIVGVTGVADLQFAFTSNGSSAGEVIREIDVDGVATAPEPSAYALCGLGLVGLLAISRLRRLTV